MSVGGPRGGSSGVRDLLTAAAARLGKAGVASPRVDAELLLAFALGVPRGRLVLASTPGEAAVTAFRALVERRAAREPLQYLVGTAAFRHIELAVGPGVFIPRPETELLVDAAAAVLDSVKSPIAVDLCAGSGALGLSIHHEFPSSRVVAVERSEGALVWLRANAASLAPDGRFAVVSGDISETTIVDVAVLAGVVGRVDVVVCNPPYVPSASSIDDEVSHDPAEAVFAGRNGLALMPPVFALAARLLRPEGLVVVEHSESHGSTLVGHVASSGNWVSVEDHVDLAGRARFLTAIRGPGQIQARESSL